MKAPELPAHGTQRRQLVGVPIAAITMGDAGLYRARETGRDRIISHIENSS